MPKVVVEASHRPSGIVLQEAIPGANTLKLTLYFDLGDGTDTFGQFCKALADGGFKDAVVQMGRELLAEAKRRHLPIGSEFDQTLGEPCGSTSKR